MKVIVLMALTVDGLIGRSSDDFPDWSGSADKKLFRQVTMRAGVVIMGSRTFDTIGKPLKGRKNVILTRNINRQSVWDNLVFTDQDPGSLLNQLEKEGFDEVVLAGGAWINTLFARQNLIDEIHVTYSPLVFGTGISLFSEAVALQLELIDFGRIGEDRILARYKVQK
jgi:dihydrofolate reductase